MGIKSMLNSTIKMGTVALCLAGCFSVASALEISKEEYDRLLQKIDQLASRLAPNTIASSVDTAMTANTVRMPWRQPKSESCKSAA